LFLEGTYYSLVQTLLSYNVSFSHNVEHHRQTDGQTDDSIMPVADSTVWHRLKNYQLVNLHSNRHYITCSGQQHTK